MKHFLKLIAAAMLCFFAAACTNDDRGYTIVDGSIVFPEPAPVSGQEDMLGFAAEPLETVRTGFVGLGMRGPDAVRRFTHIEGTQTVALCDLEQSNVDKVQDFLKSKGLPQAASYVGPQAYKELCERDDVDLVYICTDWLSHVEIALYAMEHGKHVAIEVPAATSVEECWLLVDTSERTRRHCIMLENCIYDFFELTCLNMAQQGLFGEILHAEGAYIHNLDSYWTEYHNNWRLAFNQSHAGDVYATHGFGPDCQALNIHRGDKLEYLVSMSTKSVCGSETAKRLMGSSEFANGDQTSTMVKTLNGKTILIQHNVYTPRPYDRMYQLVGTKGFADKYPVPNLAFEASNLSKDYQDLNSHSYMPANLRDELLEQYKHPIVRDIEETAKDVGGHGGMDFIMDYRLVWCLRNGKPLDMDVYDAAEWSCLGELTAASISNGSMPVRIPDFTRGRWNKLKGLTLAQ